MSCPLTPIGDKLIVELFEEVEQQTASGLFLPQQSAERPQRGTVLAVGEGHWENGQLVPMSVKPGDEIVYGKYSGTEIEHDGRKFLVMKEADVLAKISEAE